MSEKLRQLACTLFAEGVRAADPGAAVKRTLLKYPEPELDGARLLIAVGKAAGAMARAALSTNTTFDRAIIVTNYENAADISEPGAGAIAGATVFAAGHPVPDQNGARAGQAVLSALRALVAGDRVLALISGGGSALLPAPAGALTLAVKA
ncbi:MAG: DUF4147 domain-containing protein, partial [Halocynthiibacter sp.]